MTKVKRAGLGGAQRALVIVLCFLIALVRPGALSADWLGSTPSAGGTISLPECPDPGYCFMSIEARDAWAAANGCTFDTPSVECEDTEVSPEGVVATAKAVVRFADGLIDGLKQQMVDLWDFFSALFTNPGEVWEGLKALGKLIIEDPGAAAAIFLALIGDEIDRLTECGAYDRGKVIGTYVSPFFALKVAQIVAKGGNLADAVRTVKNMILTPVEKARLGIRYRPGVTQPDGKSWFEELNIKTRGVGIENALGKNTPDAFPVVDVVNKATGEVVSIKSKSSTSAYWTKPGGLRDSLKTDVRALADFLEDGVPATRRWEIGTPDAGAPFRLEQREVTSKTLQVAVKRNTLTEAHYAEIRQAQEYANRLVSEGRSSQPIRIEIIEID